ncbi:MAG: hypothetical protein JW726_07015 [Anaerolineales bacterium]|nr:hypothetical protein [Anaerolineales bacterium]
MPSPGNCQARDEHGAKGDCQPPPADLPRSRKDIRPALLAEQVNEKCYGCQAANPAQQRGPRGAR